MNTFRITTLALGLLLCTNAFATPPHGDGPPPEVQELMQHIQEKWPEKFERLMTLRESDPERFHQQMRKIRNHMGMGKKMDPELREHHEAMREKHDAFRDMAAQHPEANKKEQATIHAELLTMAEEMFDLRQEGRLLRLTRAKARIAKMETEIAERDQAREDIITDFVDDAIEDGPKGL
jgi:hypothetical protein